MTSNVGLIVVFNHRYDQNLPKLREIYRSRFGHLHFLVPCYDGPDEDVIAVYGPSDTFHSYLAQAWQHLRSRDYDYWLVVADDMIINPALDERSLPEMLRISRADSFIATLRRFHPELRWPHAHKSLSFRLRRRHYDISGELPDVEQATEIMGRRGLLSKGLRPNEPAKCRQRQDEPGADQAEQGPLRFSEYPLAWGYSDIVCVGADNLERFCHYCGAFTSARLFVEISLPSALALATRGKLVTEKQLRLRGKALWSPEELQTLDRYERRVSRLIDEFPADRLYLHPVKLSQWAME